MTSDMTSTTCMLATEVLDPHDVLDVALDEQKDLI